MEPFIGISKDDFTAISGADIVQGCENKTCREYSSYFARKANEAEESGDLKAKQIFALLSFLALRALNIETPDLPFGSLKLDQSHIRFLSEIVEDLHDPELKARILDILYIHNPDYRSAQYAVFPYLVSAERLEDPEHWTATVKRITRALQIAIRWGKNSGPCKGVVRHIERVLANYNGEDPSFLSARLMTLLLESKTFDSSSVTENALRAEKAALRAEASHKWFIARNYWSLKHRWHLSNKENDEARLAKIREAETYVQEAEHAVSGAHPSYLRASGFINFAIDTLRRTENTKERVAQLHEVLLNYQQSGTDELIPISSSVDVSDLVEIAINLVKGKPLLDALYNFTIFNRSPKKEQLRKQAAGADERYLLKRLFPSVHQNALGRIIARQSANPEESLQDDMFQNACYSRSVKVQGLIEPARQQILSEHYITTHDFLPLVSNNPYIRPGRENIVARGLLAGLQGDFLVSTHLLIPQIEDSLRYLLFHLGVITSGLDSDGIQDEFNVNKMLSAAEYTTPLGTIVGEDFVFDMRGLLVERFGANLRNDMAHGLLSENAFYMDSSSYLWWMVLRLYCLNTIAKLKTKESTDSSDSSEVDSSEV